MSEEEMVRVASNNEGRTRTELIDDMALPFLDLAEKIEAAKVNNADPEAWIAIMETNLFLWRYFQLPAAPFQRRSVQRYHGAAGEDQRVHGRRFPFRRAAGPGTHRQGCAVELEYVR